MKRGASGYSGAACLVALLSLATAAVLFPAAAKACTCMAPPNNEAQAAAQALQRADVVFIGAVSSVKTKLFSYPTQRLTTFDVLHAWKGLRPSGPVTVRTNVGGPSCGYRFEKRSTYLVFAYRDSRTGVLETNLCELNRKEAEAQGLIRELDRLTGNSDGVSD